VAYFHLWPAWLYNIIPHCLRNGRISEKQNICLFQMTQRFDLYAESLAKVAQPNYKPQIIRDK
jgi:hypothetical protein